VGVSLLGIVYYGMGLLGAFHGQGFEFVNFWELFRLISFSVLDHTGAIYYQYRCMMAWAFQQRLHSVAVVAGICST